MNVCLKFKAILLVCFHVPRCKSKKSSCDWPLVEVDKPDCQSFVFATMRYFRITSKMCFRFKSAILNLFWPMDQPIKKSDEPLCYAGTSSTTSLVLPNSLYRKSYKFQERFIKHLWNSLWTYRSSRWSTWSRLRITALNQQETRSTYGCVQISSLSTKLSYSSRIIVCAVKCFCANDTGTETLKDKQIRSAPERAAVKLYCGGSSATATSEWKWFSEVLLRLVPCFACHV